MIVMDIKKSVLEKKKRYTITVGMNDKISRQQELDWKDVVQLIHSCCKKTGNAYTIMLHQGGYYHDDGEFVLENCMDISLIDPTEGTVDEIASQLCALLHQEAVMVCVDEVSTYMLNRKSYLSASEVSDIRESMESVKPSLDLTGL